MFIEVCKYMIYNVVKVNKQGRVDYCALSARWTGSCH